MPPLSPTAWTLLAGVLGLLVGSFLNVVILRLPARMAAQWRNEARELLDAEAAPAAEPLPPGIVYEPSHCPHCGHRLGIRDNSPVLSWLLLRARCRYCRAPISAQYPLVELLCAVLSALVAWRYGPGLATVAGLVFTWMLIALAGIDLRTQLLPDAIVYPLLWLGLLLSLRPVFVEAPGAILAAAIGYLSLWSCCPPWWVWRQAAC